MNKKHFYANLDRFSEILQDNSTNLQTFLFHSKVYVEGMRKSISIVEKCCKKGVRILDLGCGTGCLSMQLSTLGFYVKGIDVRSNVEMIEEFKKKRGLQIEIWKALDSSNCRLRFYDGTTIPFNDQSFDAVIAHAVIEHIPAENLNPLLQEIQRVLKLKGYLFIFRSPRQQAYAEHVARILRMGAHNVLMNEYQVASMLEKNGFEVLCSQRTDVVFGVLPGKLQYVWNSLSPILAVIDELLLKTPISHFAHNMQIVCLKSRTVPISHNNKTKTEEVRWGCPSSSLSNRGHKGGK